MRLRWGVAALLGILGLPSGGRADTVRPDARTGLPGLVRVVTADPLVDEAGFAVSSAYGYRGATLGADDRHHRVMGAVAANVRLAGWLAIGAVLDGRYDKHVLSTASDDDGWIGDPRLLIRARRQLASRISIAGELGLWLPAESLFGVDGTSLEGRSAASYRLTPTLSLTANAGVRLDRSSGTVREVDRLSLADRMSLGVSDASAVLLGAGLGWQAGRTSVAAEWTWDWLVGDDAPAMRQSPMRLAGTVRRQVRRGMWLSAVLEVSVSSTPSIELGAPLVPLEPRATAWLVASYRFGKSSRSSVSAPTPTPTPAPTPTPVAVVSFAGVVNDSDGAPIVGALVRLGDREATTGEDGAFELADVPMGKATLIIEAPGHEPLTREVDIGVDGVDAPVAAVLERSLPAGQIRGLVRSIKGKPIRGARIAVEGLGLTTTTDAEGRFSIDVPPGTYSVEVTAGRHKRQVRTIRVDDNGVTVLNADLVRSR